MSPNTMPPDNLKTEERTVNFVADVHLIQILGEQLIGSEKVGILELIKNAYDARATTCDVWIEKVPGFPETKWSDPAIKDLPGPVITIIDNGIGMDENTIINGWLRPATRLKTSVKEKLKQERAEANLRGTLAEYDSLVNILKKEYGGRLPLGEKGVGRFATHRLGKHLLLRTKTVEDTYEWVLDIDWEKFDRPNDDPTRTPLDLGKVGLKLIHRPPESDYGPTNSGTVLRIYGERVGFKWTDTKLRDIGQAIAFLHSPYEANKTALVKDTKPKLGFTPVFHCPQLGGGEFEVLTNTVPAPFLSTAIVDDDGIATLEIQFNPPASLKKPLSPDIVIIEGKDLRVPPKEKKELNYWFSPESKSKLRTPECGPFTCEIKVWIRTKDWIDYLQVDDFTNFLDNFGGIGIYRDGLSIVPAQVASKDDWLGLSKRHIKRGSHISYYNMWGSVDLVQEKTLYLVDLTSREGLLETRPFEDLRELLRQIIFDVELYVQKKRDEYKELLDSEKPSIEVLNEQSKVASNIFKNLSSNYDFKADPLGIKPFIGETDPKRYITSLANTYAQVVEEISELDEQSNALLETAGYGIAIGVAVHEIEKITSNLFFGLERLLEKATSLDPEVYRQVDQLSGTANTLLTELRRISPLRVTRLERPRKFSIRDSILVASGAFRLSWDDLNITFIPPMKESDFQFVGSFGACSQVFANLFDNATYWLRTTENNRRIVVQVDPQKKKVIIADSGPGIDKQIRPKLFEPFYSLKNPPSGLGLYICNYYLRQMKGTIRESYDDERLPGIGGAQFTLIFPGEEPQV
jgi:signal transduction histidine kinase